MFNHAFKRFSAICFLLLFLLTNSAGFALAQDVSFSISGQVVDSDQNPLSGVIVGDTAGHTAVTDENGAYTIPDLQAGIYTIRAAKEGLEFVPFYREIKLTAENVSEVNFHVKSEGDVPVKSPERQSRPAPGEGAAPLGFSAEPYVPASIEEEIVGPALRGVSQPRTEFNAIGVPTFRYMATYGTPGAPWLPDTESIYLARPAGLYMSSEGYLYVADKDGNQVVTYNPSGDFETLIGEEGKNWSEEYIIGNPKDVALDYSESGKVNQWILEGRRLVKYTLDPSPLTYQFQYPEHPWECDPSGPTCFGDNVWGLDIDTAGNIFVSDTDNGQVTIFSQGPENSLTETHTFDSLSSPRHIVVAGEVPTGKLYIANTDDHTILKCNLGDPNYDCSIALGVSGEAGNDYDHLKRPYSLAFYDGYAYVLDSDNLRLLKCNTASTPWECDPGSDPNAGTFAGIAGESGWDNEHFEWEADDVVVQDNASGDDYIYVSDSSNNRVQGFNLADGSWARRVGITRVGYQTDTAHLNHPVNLVIRNNKLYIQEDGSGSRRILRYTLGGVYDGITYTTERGCIQEAPGVDSQGRVYIAASCDENRVHIYNADGTYFATISGSKQGGVYRRFKSPVAVFIDVDDNIYVVDREDSVVHIFDPNRVYKATLGDFSAAGGGVSGNGMGQFNWPRGIVVDSAKNVYVADYNNRRVMKWTYDSGYNWTAPASTFVGRDDNPGNWFFDQLNCPRGLAVDAQDRVYIPDECSDRVQVFSSAGDYVTTIGGGWGSAYSGEVRSPAGAAVDSAGNVYIADSNNHRIQKYARGVPSWSQINTNGFGFQQNRGNALGYFGSVLYAGTNDSTGAAEPSLYRWDGNTDHIVWEHITSGNFSGNQSFTGFAVHNNWLYASASNWHCMENCEDGDGSNDVWGSDGPMLYRSASGDSDIWQQVSPPINYGDTRQSGITSMAVFNNQLYVGTGMYYGQNGHDTDPTLWSPQLWRCTTCDGSDWEQLTSFVSTTLSDSGNSIPAIVTFANALWAVTSDGEVWRSANGTAWAQVTADTFGSEKSINSMAVYGTDLYIGTRSKGTEQPSLIYCNASKNCASAANWTKFTSTALSTPSAIDGLITMGSYLYIVTYEQSGLREWRTDGVSWQNISGSTAFGNSLNLGLSSNGLAVRASDNRLFVAPYNINSSYSNSNGGGIWMSDPLPNPAPSITSLTPNGIGPTPGKDLTITVNGSGFTRDSVVKWDNAGSITNLVTSFVSSAKLKAVVPANLLAVALVKKKPVTRTVSVFTPAPGGGTSGTLPFTIRLNPKPKVVTVSPTSAKAGSALTLTINGSGFDYFAQVKWDNVVLTDVTYISDTQITAAVPANLVTASGAKAKKHKVTVINPKLGGGSAFKYVMITP
jgi:sugar lactone lactonase YvrE